MRKRDNSKLKLLLSLVSDSGLLPGAACRADGVKHSSLLPLLLATPVWSKHVWATVMLDFIYLPFLFCRGVPLLGLSSAPHVLLWTFPSPLSISLSLANQPRVGTTRRSLQRERERTERQLKHNMTKKHVSGMARLKNIPGRAPCWWRNAAWAKKTLSAGGCHIFRADQSTWIVAKYPTSCTEPSKSCLRCFARSLSALAPGQKSVLLWGRPKISSSTLLF